MVLLLLCAVTTPWFGCAPKPVIATDPLRVVALTSSSSVATSSQIALIGPSVQAPEARVAPGVAANESPAIVAAPAVTALQVSSFIISSSAASAVVAPRADTLSEAQRVLLELQDPAHANAELVSIANGFRANRPPVELLEKLGVLETISLPDTLQSRIATLHRQVETKAAQEKRTMLDQLRGEVEAGRWEAARKRIAQMRARLGVELGAEGDALVARMNGQQGGMPIDASSALATLESARVLQSMGKYLEALRAARTAQDAPTDSLRAAARLQANQSGEAFCEEQRRLATQEVQRAMPKKDGTGIAGAIDRLEHCLRVFPESTLRKNIERDSQRLRGELRRNPTTTSIQ
jgi:hypothetical protein